MGISVHVLHQAPIGILTNRFRSLDFLNGHTVQKLDRRRWHRGEKTSHDLQCIFIGKTGYGKSTTINSIIGKELFATDATRSCTKELYCADFMLRDGEEDFFSLGDLPGVGESVAADREYLGWYRDFLAKTDCVVYLLRADQRDYSIDCQLFDSLLKESRGRVVIGLNYCDKVEPVNRRSPFMPTAEQERNISLKVQEAANCFSVDPARIIPFSAAEGWNLDRLMMAVARVISHEL